MELTNYILAIMVIVQLIYIFILESLHRKERINLYDRAMAKDLHELNEVQGKPHPGPRNGLKKNIQEDLLRNGFLKE